MFGTVLVYAASCLESEGEFEMRVTMKKVQSFGVHRMLRIGASSSGGVDAKCNTKTTFNNCFSNHREHPVVRC